MIGINTVLDLKKYVKQKNLSWKDLWSKSLYKEDIADTLYCCRIGGRDFMVKEYNTGQEIDIFPRVSTESINCDFVR